MKVVLYGAGTYGKQFCSEFSKYFNAEEYELLGFLDSNPDRVGEFICGKPIIKLETVKKIEDVIIVITIASKKAKKEVVAILEKEGLADKIFSFNGPMNGYYSSEVNTQILISLLKLHGIKKIIVSPGTTNLSFVASVQRDSYFELYSAPDERSASYIACGMSKESGEVIVLSCTGATASRNYLPGLTEAYYSKLPVLAITSSQHSGRIGQLVPQVIDRTSSPSDAVKYSIELPSIHVDEDVWACELKVNSALLELRRDGGGPVHINLITTYSGYFTKQKLPTVRCIERFFKGNILPELKPGRVGIFVGSHKKWSKELLEVVDQFCKMYNAVVFCDHTSNYWGEYRIIPSLVCHQTEKKFSCCKMDVMIHIGEVSGSYAKMKPNEIWRVSPDGEVRDTFKKLHFVFEMEEQIFFEQYVNKGCIQAENSYLIEWKQEQDKLRQAIPDIPFSNIWIAQQMSKRLPKDSILHLGILNTLRSWNYFETTDGIIGYANTGGFGIDGCVSTAVGTSLANPNKLVFCIIGDLAFFYDINVMGNLHVCKNFRVLMINNGCGTEFHNYDHKGSILGLNKEPYVSAAGHYGNRSSKLVRHYAQDLGFEYMCTHNKEGFLQQLDYFVSADNLDKPIIFEVFTDSQKESDALYLMRHLQV